MKLALMFHQMPLWRVWRRYTKWISIIFWMQSGGNIKMVSIRGKNYHINYHYSHVYARNVGQNNDIVLTVARHYQADLLLGFRA